MKKQFLILFAFISVLALSQVPQRFNKVIVTGDITSPKFIKTGSNADSVLLGNGSARAISTIKTDTVSLSNRINAKATGNGTANGTNTGDETLTSIKTKLWAATAFSDGYLKYQDFNIFSKKEPSFLKNTAFNKNFGSTTGTVLEGRTFGTAANSAVGDFIQNQNSSAQSANMWISGNGYFGGNIFGNTFNGLSGGDVAISTNTGGGSNIIFKTSGTEAFRIAGRGGAATFSSTVNSTGFLLNGNNLTSSLTANYIPKWNGSNFVNSLISDDGVYAQVPNSSGISFGDNTTKVIGNSAAGVIDIQTGSTSRLLINTDGHLSVSSTTPSTSPATGALVVGGGVGADHVRANQFYGNGSNLTGVQLPITLTTNGTSGAATFSGNVLNVPNYDVSGGVNQTQTTVNGSTSGNMVCSMPFRTGAYKKVIIEVKNLNGNASYTYPTAFTAVSNPDAYPYIQRLTGSYTEVSTGKTAFSITGGNNTSGWIIIEGY